MGAGGCLGYAHHHSQGRLQLRHPDNRETEGRSGGEGEKRKWSGEVVKWERRREKKGGEE